MRMIGEWHKCLDQSGVVGAVLMDLSKAFDCIDHKLLLAKLSAYGLDDKSLKLIKCYLSDRSQRTKIDSSLSDLMMLLIGVPQGSILGPLLFNIFINDIIYFVEKADICNFADDNSLFCCGSEISTVLANLRLDLLNLLKWFSSNRLAANPEKFQMLVLGNSVSDKSYTLSVSEVTIKSTDSVKLLGITIDNKLSFKSHINTLCAKVSRNIRRLRRISKYLNENQLKLVLQSFIMSNFNYAPIIWMFCRKSSANQIENIHKRALRAVYNDYNSSYEQLLSKRGHVKIHEIHLRHLLCEIYKTTNGLNPSFMKNVFTGKNVTYSMRSCNLLTIHPARTTTFGTQSFMFRGSYLWNLLPDSLKDSRSITHFKCAIKGYNLSNLCGCVLCKTTETKNLVYN